MLLSNSTLVLKALQQSQAIIEFDLDGNILDANRNFCSALGYDRSEIVGRHHSMFVKPHEAESAEYREFWSQLRTGEFQTGEFRRFGKNGKEVWIQATYNAVRDRGGKPCKIVKCAIVTTGKKLKANEDGAKLDAVSRTQAIIEFDPTGIILDANENFCKTVGYALEEIVGRHHRMFVGPDYAVQPEYLEFWDRLAAGEFIAEEFKRFGKGNREVWIQASYNPIFDADGKVIKVVKFATDITGRVRAVNEIGGGLNKLADGDLRQHIDEPFIPSLDRLRTDFNSSVERLEAALSQVGINASVIMGGTSEIKTASDELARRTEQQAASVEETAAAVEQIAATVKTTAQRAEEAGLLSQATKSEAEKSGAVVEEAVLAMDEIKDSSDKISSIIGMIDDIAFQTNLLALNAGVEAARAGEAGRGFAVVAQEVRELAQRSASAAKDIRALINTSGGQVQSGVDLVAATGQALKSIVGSIVEVTDHVSAIVEASREQSNGLEEINRAVNTIDEGTQQNAAMAEEATASSHTLETEAVALTKMLGQFKLAAVPAAGRSGAALAPSGRTAAPVLDGNAAVNSESWAEF